MKKSFLSFLLLSATALAPAMAQVPPQEEPGPAVQQARMERIEALKITFIAQRLNLTKGESDRFWPLFYQYQKEVHGVSVNKAMDEITREQAILNVRRKFQEQFSSIIGRNRSNYVFQSEHDFNQLLIQRFKHPNPGARLGPRRGF